MHNLWQIGDPAGVRANLDGANLDGANLDMTALPEGVRIVTASGVGSAKRKTMYRAMVVFFRAYRDVK